jgi:hypothetical protein
MVSSSAALAQVVIAARAATSSRLSRSGGIVDAHDVQAMEEILPEASLPPRALREIAGWLPR